jgi:transcriptional regulator GlxA family with amidase domain
MMIGSMGISPSPQLSPKRGSPAVPTRKRRHYRGIVDRIWRIARNRRLEAPLHIGELCRIASVSQRTLRNAFHVVHGVTPYRYLRALRMKEARQALVSPGPAGLTVTQVATRFGFFELGRFAVEYRLTFGESPSATLRRSSAPAAPRAMPRASPHSNVEVSCGVPQ